MSEVEKFRFEVGVSKRVNSIDLKNILSELKEKNIVIHLKEDLSNNFIIEETLSKEQIKIVTDIFRKYGMGGSHFPIS